MDDIKRGKYFLWYTLSKQISFGVLWTLSVHSAALTILWIVTQLSFNIKTSLLYHPLFSFPYSNWVCMRAELSARETVGISLFVWHVLNIWNCLFLYQFSFGFSFWPFFALSATLFSMSLTLWLLRRQQRKCCWHFS